jgi:hypothetical protein
MFSRVKCKSVFEAGLEKIYSACQFAIKVIIIRFMYYDAQIFYAEIFSSVFSP